MAQTTTYCGSKWVLTPKKHDILWFEPICNTVEILLSYGCSKRTALSTAPLHHPSIRVALVAPRVPCQVHNAQLKPLIRTAQQRAAHSSAQRRCQRVEAPSRHSTAHIPQQLLLASAFQSRRCRARAKLKGRYWCTLKNKYRAVRIQLHHRVTVVSPAPVV